MRLHRCLTVLFVFLTLAGCSKGFVPFGGKVTFEEDGSPLTRGVVVFSTDTFQAEGGIKADGTYRLGSLKINDGLPPGTYKVFLSNAGALIGETYVSDVDLIYTNRIGTPLICEVPASGIRAFDFHVKKYTPSKKSKR